MIVMEKRCKGNKVTSNLPSPLSLSTIHAQRQVMMQRTSASLTPSTLFLAKPPQNRKSSWAPTITQTSAHLTTCTPPKFCTAIGPYGLPKCNNKGKNLLHIYLAHRLQARSQSPWYGTWTSNQPTNSGIVDTHMLNVIVCSAILHKCIHNCCMTLDGLDSNQWSTWPSTSPPSSTR